MAGWVLGQAGLKTKSRKGLAALILGANMPDIDVFFGHSCWEPLATHRGFTHGLLGGVILMPPLLAGLLWLLDRWQVSRGDHFRSGLPMRFGQLLLLSYLGTLTHPFLDLMTTYSVQLFSPFSTRWYHADALFIIDLVLWILLATSIFWSRRKEQMGGHWRRPAQAAVGVVLTYIAVNLFISERAKDTVHVNGARPEAIFASPPPAYFWRRGLVWREGDCYRSASYDPLGGGRGPVSECRPNNMRNPGVVAALRSDPQLRAFLRWSVFPIAGVQRSRCSVKVIIGDARYQDAGTRARLMRESLLPTGAPGC